jgi:hypothetical protein
MVLFGQKFLIINRTQVVPKPPYIPDVSPADFSCSEIEN